MKVDLSQHLNEHKVVASANPPLTLGHNEAKQHDANLGGPGSRRKGQKGDFCC